MIFVTRTAVVLFKILEYFTYPAGGFSGGYRGATPGRGPPSALSNFFSGEKIISCDGVSFANFVYLF